MITGTCYPLFFCAKIGAFVGAFIGAKVGAIYRNKM